LGQEERERALGWERQLSSGSWRGAADLAPVVLHAAAEVASWAHTHALACFADGRPLVSTAERGSVEGTPDWVDNTCKAVQVMALNGLVAPARVLIDGGSFYSMAGLSLRTQLGLTAVDMDAGGHKVHTATGKVEALPGGLTKNPVPIVFNKGEPSEVTLYERLAFTDSRGYDLLVGTRAAYPCGLSVDRWAERATYRADWRGKGEVVGHLPMKLHQDRQAGWTQVGGRKRRGQSSAGATFACCLTECKKLPGWGGAEGQSAPAASPAEGMGVSGRDLLAVRQAQRSFKARWPRGPRAEIAQEDASTVGRAIGERRLKVARPPWVPLPQLAGLRPLDQSLVPALPRDRPLRVLELFAGVGAGTQALARLGYHVGEVVACEAWGAARVVHAHAVAELAKEFPGTVARRAGAQMHHKLPQDIRLVSADHLRELGPVDLVVAGWPCQGSSTAGTGRARSGLFTELVRVLGELQALHQTWIHPLGYLIEHVSAGADRRPKVREHFAAVRGVLGPELVVDAAQLGSRAHRLRAWWTNLEGMPLLRSALGVQQRAAGLFVHQVLGPGRRARLPQFPGVLPWAKVETPGEPRRALNTFVSYGGSYAFSRGGGGVLACVQPGGEVTYEEPTTDVGELAMGFPRGFTAARGISEHTRRELLGQAMDLNSIMWILAAARSAGERRLPLGGEAVSERSQAGVGAPGEARGEKASGRGEAEGAGPAVTGQGAGGARGGGRVSPSPQPVGRRTRVDGTSSTGAGPGGQGAAGPTKGPASEKS
jgi:hypothetical protein